MGSESEGIPSTNQELASTLPMYARQERVYEVVILTLAVKKRRRRTEHSPCANRLNCLWWLFYDMMSSLTDIVGIRRVLCSRALTDRVILLKCTMCTLAVGVRVHLRFALSTRHLSLEHRVFASTLRWGSTARWFSSNRKAESLRVVVRL
jgi:hypothetical protein